MHVSAGLDASNDEVYAFPYGQEMSVQPSYKGHRKLIKEYAVGKPVVDLKCFTVRENEEFIVEYGATEDKWEYKSKVFNNAPVLGYVTVLVHEDGTSRVMEHTLEEIEKRRFAGISGNSPAWKSWEVEMSRAKAIKRHAKTVDIKLRQDIQDLVSKIEKSDYEIYEVEETKIQLPESEDSPQRVEDGEEHHVARWVGESEEEVEPEEDVPEVDPEDESWIE